MYIGSKKLGISAGDGYLLGFSLLKIIYDDYGLCTFYSSNEELLVKIKQLGITRLNKALEELNVK
jgi:hypothetical protein